MISPLVSKHTIRRLLFTGKPPELFYKSIFIWICFLFIAPFSSAQQHIITGIINDGKSSSLPGAAVSLLHENDSTAIISGVTDINGKFSLVTTASSGILKISYVGFNDYFSRITLNGNPDLGIIKLREKSTLLDELNVTDEKIPVQTRGDTIQFNADAFKVNRDANAEDLATKMPGINVQDGKMQAQGEDVKKVLIDGKPFLGDDPNAAMRNLPAEVIDKIQVFDKKSDQAEFTGFDDGNTTKTINIITRPQFRNGVFGKAFAGYGTDDLWKTGANINSFKDKRKLTFLGNANNVNEQNFTTDDLLGVIGTGSGRGDRPRGGTVLHRAGGGRYGQNDASNFLVDQKNGIITTYSAGINYANTWNKLDFSGSYFYNQTQNNLKSILTRQYYTGDGLTYRESNEGKNDNYNHRANFRMEYKFDSLNSILFQPRFSFQKNNSITSLNGVNSNNEGPLSFLVSPYTSKSDGYNFSAPLLFRHSFSKKGRTISVNVNPSLNDNEGESRYNSATIYTDTISADSVNQFNDNSSDSKTVLSEVTFTEPVGKSGQLSIGYRNNYSLSSADKLTYSNEVFDTSFSNSFESQYITHTPTLLYRYQKEKWNAMIGGSYQWSLLKNEQTFPSEGNIDRQFNSFLPSFMLQYRFTTKKQLRIYYRSSNNAPTVNQLQNVINNSNPLQLTTGNPFLKQDWQNFIIARYSATNSEKNTSFFIFSNFSYTFDYIGNSSLIAQGDTTVDGVFLSEGTQLTRPVNLDGYYSSRLYTNYSFPVKKIKSTLNVNGMFTYSRSPGMINNIINYSNYLTGGLGFALSSNISEKIDFLLSMNGTRNNVQNSSQTSSDSKYYNLASRFRIQVMVYKGIVAQTEISHQLNTGLSTQYNQNYFLWNASLGYKFLENQQAELRLTVFDILKQNKSISRNTTDLYYEDVQTNVLQQYFMLTFTYNLKKFAGK